MNLLDELNQWIAYYENHLALSVLSPQSEVFVCVLVIALHKPSSSGRQVTVQSTRAQRSGLHLV